MLICREMVFLVCVWAHEKFTCLVRKWCEGVWTCATYFYEIKMVVYIKPKFSIQGQHQGIEYLKLIIQYTTTSPSSNKYWYDNYIKIFQLVVTLIRFSASMVDFVSMVILACYLICLLHETRFVSMSCYMGGCQKIDRMVVMKNLCQIQTTSSPLWNYPPQVQCIFSSFSATPPCTPGSILLGFSVARSWWLLHHKNGALLSLGKKEKKNHMVIRERRFCSMLMFFFMARNCWILGAL